jgi:hypothetical protein
MYWQKDIIYLRNLALVIKSSCVIPVQWGNLIARRNAVQQQVKESVHLEDKTN